MILGGASLSNATFLVRNCSFVLQPPSFSPQPLASSLEFPLSGGFFASWFSGQKRLRAPLNLLHLYELSGDKFGPRRKFVWGLGIRPRRRNLPWECRRTKLAEGMHAPQPTLSRRRLVPPVSVFGQVVLYGTRRTVPPLLTFFRI